MGGERREAAGQWEGAAGRAVRRGGAMQIQFEKRAGNPSFAGGPWRVTRPPSLHSLSAAAASWSHFPAGPTQRERPRCIRRICPARRRCGPRPPRRRPPAPPRHPPPPLFAARGPASARAAAAKGRGGGDCAGHRGCGGGCSLPRPPWTPEWPPPASPRASPPAPSSTSAAARRQRRCPAPPAPPRPTRPRPRRRRGARRAAPCTAPRTAGRRCCSPRSEQPAEPAPR